VTASRDREKKKGGKTWAQLFGGERNGVVALYHKKGHGYSLASRQRDGKKKKKGWGKESRAEKKRRRSLGRDPAQRRKFFGVGGFWGGWWGGGGGVGEETWVTSRKNK